MSHSELKAIYILAKSGTVLFTSEFSGLPKTSTGIGGLITALLDVSSRSVFSPISYIRMNHLAVTICQNEYVGVKVVLFHDADFYRELAQAITSNILRSFCDRFSPEEIKHAVDNMLFKRFNTSLGPSIRDCSGHLIHDLVEKLRGSAHYAVVFNEGDPKFAYPSNADSITVAANLQQLIFAIQEVSNLTNDVPFELVVESNQLFSHIALIGSTIVILQIRKQVHSQEIVDKIKHTLDMVKLCAQTADCLTA